MVEGADFVKTMLRNRPLVTLVLAAALLFGAWTGVATSKTLGSVPDARSTSSSSHPLARPESGEPDGTGNNAPTAPKITSAVQLPSSVEGLRQWIYLAYKVWMVRHLGKS